MAKPETVPVPRPRPRLAAAVAACAAASLALAPGAAEGAGAARAGRADPVYVNFHAPGEQATYAPEPSVGANWKTGAVLFQAGTRTYRLDFSGTGRATTARWTDVTYVLEGVQTLDPILFTDSRTGRTFVSQLLLGCSVMSYTDDDGATWTPTEGCGPGSAFDHQSVASGPYAGRGLLPADRPEPVASYPHAVYYCAQAVVDASCARSDDGGLTFGPGVPMYTIADCAGLHGHMRIAPDGTLYVPNFDCRGEHAVVVSEDDGLSWQVRRVPGSVVNRESDGSVAVGAGGTVYYGWQNGPERGDNRAMVAVSSDKGRTWRHVTDVGKALGVRNVQFPEVIAGDDDRAAFAFLGTRTGGDDQHDGFAGVWHLYVATTFDGGRTWRTVDATPREIVQRGCIMLTRCSGRYRNLLDFNDIAVDREGRVVVAWADGCYGECERDPRRNTLGAQGVVTRQVAGRTLFRRYDRVFAR